MPDSSQGNGLALIALIFTFVVFIGLIIAFVLIVQNTNDITLLQTFQADAQPKLDLILVDVGTDTVGLNAPSQTCSFQFQNAPNANSGRQLTWNTPLIAGNVFSNYTASIGLTGQPSPGNPYFGMTMMGDDIESRNITLNDAGPL